MATYTKISELGTAGTITGAELIALVQSGTLYQIPLSSASIINSDQTSYAVFANGTQVCWGTDTGAATGSASNLFGSSSGVTQFRLAVATFGRAFSTAPTVLVSAQYTTGTYIGIAAYAQDVAATSCTIVHGLRATAGDYKANYFAIGIAS